MTTAIQHRPAERMDEFLLAAAGTTPDRPAVIEYTGDRSPRAVSYRELAALAERYAADLAELGLDIGDRVVVESDTSASAIAMLIACGRRGLPFVPISPETPATRVLAIVAECAPALCLRASEQERVAVPSRIGVGRFGPEGLDVERRPAPRTRQRQQLTTCDTAYIIFTSGTTGRPKGVVMSHRAVVAFYLAMAAEGIVGPTDRVASTSPLQFDFSLLDIGLALGSGAAVVPVPRALLRWPRRFVRVLGDTGATQVNGVPSIWRQALRHTPEALRALDHLRGILFCGEEFPHQELRRLTELLPGARFVNCYGSTESMACSFADVPKPLPTDPGPLSIGRGHKGAELLIVDESGQPIGETGVVGALHLRSPALFTGYWADEAATDAALVPDPHDRRAGQKVLRTGDLAYRDATGDLHFCGRTDAQVQIRGNRVELGEVERKLMDFGGVETAAVIGQQLDGETGLVAFVVPATGVELDERGLRSFCTRTLPGYMVPERVQVVSDLPVTTNGKVSREALMERTG
ncbi:MULTISPECIES: AMP-binding protein [Amycolatopsis]|uniref:Uncharacterized protein n=1 Tax=Amycolatopsis bullii TaxID=941987 RepID=A0ABQ3KE97_9PSEU|nr:AMP-binding protein [Amycolatopsis bullii]GHG14351.1 hypothetical protein GCM10017567_35170 [Amycolatopsis bullii]